MSDGGDALPGPMDPVLKLSPDEFLARMETYERVLVELKEKLYEGSWERILADLRARVSGQPYIYKLSQTIARDIAAIERMRAYEQRHGVDLSQLMKPGRSKGTGHSGSA